MKSIALGLALWLAPWIATTAQQTGILRFVVDPGHDFSFIVDKTHRLQQREITLTEGLHHFSVWAPTRSIVDTSVFVVAGHTSDLVMKLPLSSEFVAYRKELSAYQVRKRWTIAAPLIALAGSLTWTGIAWGKYADAKDVLEADRVNYAINVDPAAIAALKSSTIPLHNDELKQARTKLMAATGLSVASAVATYLLAKRTSTWQVPLFEDEQKVKFDGMAWVPDPHGNVFMAGLIINLTR
ncbi:MAG: hypothetical protein JNM62_11155 [Flavobacteriales bacterium]|nr:hypothetical protein [Flavobacteriales bacterium]